MIAAELRLDWSNSVAHTVAAANEAMGIQPEGTIAQQVQCLMRQLGLENSMQTFGFADHADNVHRRRSLSAQTSLDGFNDDASYDNSSSRASTVLSHRRTSVAHRSTCSGSGTQGTFQSPKSHLAVIPRSRSFNRASSRVVELESPPCADAMREANAQALAAEKALLAVEQSSFGWAETGEARRVLCNTSARGGERGGSDSPGMTRPPTPGLIRPPAAAFLSPRKDSLAPGPTWNYPATMDKLRSINKDRRPSSTAFERRPSIRRSSSFEGRPSASAPTMRRNATPNPRSPSGLRGSDGPVRGTATLATLATVKHYPTFWRSSNPQHQSPDGLRSGPPSVAPSRASSVPSSAALGSVDSDSNMWEHVPSYARFTQNYAINRNQHLVDWNLKAEERGKLVRVQALARMKAGQAEEGRRQQDEQRRLVQARALAECRAELINGGASEYDRQFLPEEFAAGGDLEGWEGHAWATDPDGAARPWRCSTAVRLGGED